MRKIIVALAALTVVTVHADQVNVSAKGEDNMHCKMDHKCDIKGTHDIEIVNDTPQDHVYDYQYLTFVYLYGYQVGVEDIRKNIVVRANSVFKDHHDTFTKHTFGDGNTYAKIVETTVWYGKKEWKEHNQYKIRVK